MKLTGILMISIFGVFMLINIITSVVGNYQYSKEYSSYWELSIKASSISKKIEGIDKFVDALDPRGGN